MNRCPFDYHPKKKRKFICLDCGEERKQLEDEPDPSVVNRHCGKAATRMGDVVYLIANVIGFKEPCTGCKKRRKAMNAFDRRTRQKIQQGWAALSRMGRKK